VGPSRAERVDVNGFAKSPQLPELLEIESSCWHVTAIQRLPAPLQQGPAREGRDRHSAALRKFRRVPQPLSVITQNTETNFPHDPDLPL